MTYQDRYESEEFLQGKADYHSGRPMPYDASQGSPTRVKAIAWRQGYSAARKVAEIAEQEAEGHFRSRT